MRGKFVRALEFTPCILGIAISAGLVIHSFGGEIKDYIQSVKLEREIEDINNQDFSTPASLAEELKEQISDTTIKNNPPKKEKELPIKELISKEEELPVDRYPISDSLLRSGYEFDIPNFEEFAITSPDLDAWIKVDGTNIDQAIMHVESDDKSQDFYSNHDMYGNSFKFGTPYLFKDNVSLNNAEEDISDVSVIYGHHIKGNRVFSDVSDYISQAYYDAHPFGVVYTADGYAYKVTFFAGIITPGGVNSEIYKDKFEDEEAFERFVNNAKEKSTFKSDVELSFGDKLMVLYTCEYTGGSDSRYALFGVLEKQYTNELQITNDDTIKSQKTR